MPKLPSVPVRPPASETRTSRTIHPRSFDDEYRQQIKAGRIFKGTIQVLERPSSPSEEVKREEVKPYEYGSVRDLEHRARFPGGSERARRLGEAYDRINALLDQSTRNRAERTELVLKLLDEKARRLHDKSTSADGLTVAPTPARPLPTLALNPWAERDKTLKETPVVFAERNYGEWFDRGLTRPVLAKLDAPLMRAVAVWEHRHPEQRLTRLLTVSEAINQKLERVSEVFAPDDIARLAMAVHTRRRRENKD